MLGRGATFDRYTLESVLGRGGMGTVYRAYDAKLRRAVALKLLHVDEGGAPSAEQQESGNARLLREARAAAALTHESAVAIYDVGEHDGVAYIAMELVEGRSLRALVGVGHVPMATRTSIALDVAQALAAAHRRGLIHRDIKPENVMVRPDGAVKVLDFGLARDVRDDVASSRAPAPPRLGAGGGTLSTMSRDGALAGTPRYMAPEQLRGDPQDARTDQFSWGVLAYELLTGRPPWAGDTLSLSLVAAIENDEPPSPRQLDAAVPELWERVILRALAKSPADRFTSMDDLMAALGEHPVVHHGLDGPPIAGSAHTLRQSSRGERSRGRRVGLALASLALVGAAGVASTQWLSRRAVQAASSASIQTLGADSSAPSTAPTGIVDLPVPASGIPEARAAYVAGLHALRDGSVPAAVAAFARASELDPSMAQAHLQLVLWDQYAAASQVHEHFARALEQRTLLSERDQAVLWMMEPWYLASARDELEVTARARQLAKRWPLDAELLLWLGSREADAATEIAINERVLEIDPRFMLAFMRLSNVQLLTGNYEGALAALDRCLTQSPSSSGCLSGRVAAYEELGRCGDMETDARFLASTSPSARSHDWVARALYANRAPDEAVLGALSLKWAAAKGDQREAFRRQDEAHLAILHGDLLGAERLLREMLAAVSQSPSEDERAAVVVPLLELELEMGQGAAAARLASDYLSQRSAWQSADEWSPLPELYAVAVHAGLRTEAQRRAAVAGWLHAWDGIEGPLHLQSWVLGYAIPATTRADAVAALEAAPTPLPLVHSNQFHREGLEANGRVLLLAGRPAEAVPYLRAAAAACSTLQIPLEHTQASLHLGQALEQTGDVAGACAAYQVVLDRWGAAHPRSASAEQARARFRVLACP